MFSNSTILVGNLPRTPELRYSDAGAPMATFSLAVNRRWRNRDASTISFTESVSFFSIIAFGDLAEHIAQSVRKGDRVVVTGRLEQRHWETKDHEKRSSYELVADEVAVSLRWATAEINRVVRARPEVAPPPDDNPFAPDAHDDGAEVGGDDGDPDSVAGGDERPLVGAGVSG